MPVGSEMFSLSEVWSWAQPQVCFHVPVGDPVALVERGHKLSAHAMETFPCPERGHQVWIAHPRPGLLTGT